jgi:hypothetical protein
MVSGLGRIRMGYQDYLGVPFLSVELFHICGAAQAPNGARPVVLSKERILIIAVRVVVVFAFLKFGMDHCITTGEHNTAVGYYSGLESPFQAQFRDVTFIRVKERPPGPLVSGAQLSLLSLYVLL